MAKFIWRGELTEEEFIETFGKNPGWVISPGPRGYSPKGDGANETNVNEKGNSQKDD
tara:strand:+ start:344 stop:514 length:171 start_codon:yes stop_codon:yes gene_type:complete